MGTPLPWTEVKANHSSTAVGTEWDVKRSLVLNMEGGTGGSIFRCSTDTEAVLVACHGRVQSVLEFYLNEAFLKRFQSTGSGLVGPGVSGEDGCDRRGPRAEVQDGLGKCRGATKAGRAKGGRGVWAGKCWRG